ncbi:cytokine receptor-like factor 3 [Gadus morhua]|nr:cytokine receptor-like factor 3 [Gadus morhua]XP_030196764.1 cytokine receptor-like factor 3 [Gadus morhua]
MEGDAMRQEAKESIEAAQNYRRELQLRLTGLKQACTQVRGSSSQARDALRRHFSELQAAAARLLAARLAQLVAQVDALEEQSLRPLTACQTLILQGVGQADQLLREGEAALRCDVEEDGLGSFNQKALNIHLDSLLEVPALVDVACVSAQLDDSVLEVLKEMVVRHGSVSSHPPVQIMELQERPGAMLVRWAKVDEDFSAVDYRLQYRRAAGGGAYEDAYVGGDCEVVVVHLDPQTEHLFRVSARGDGGSSWSPWSVPVAGSTSLAPHEWSPGTDGFILSSRRNIAMRCDSAPSGSPVLYSNGATYCPGQTLTFKVSAVGQADNRDGLGVCVERESGQETLQRDQAVCISTKGAVFVNGKEMTNRLPALALGSAVTFDMEVVALFSVGSSNNPSEGGANVKLRVTIGCGSREVVFDWLLETAVDGLLFGCCFAHTGWKVLVF